MRHKTPQSPLHQGTQRLLWALRRTLNTSGIDDLRYTGAAQFDNHNAVEEHCALGRRGQRRSRCDSSFLVLAARRRTS